MRTEKPAAGPRPAPDPQDHAETVRRLLEKDPAEAFAELRKWVQESAKPKELRDRLSAIDHALQSLDAAHKEALEKKGVASNKIIDELRVQQSMRNNLAEMRRIIEEKQKTAGYYASDALERTGDTVGWVDQKLLGTWQNADAVYHGLLHASQDHPWMRVLVYGIPLIGSYGVYRLCKLALGGGKKGFFKRTFRLLAAGTLALGGATVMGLTARKFFPQELADVRRELAPPEKPLPAAVSFDALSDDGKRELIGQPVTINGIQLAAVKAPDGRVRLEVNGKRFRVMAKREDRPAPASTTALDYVVGIAGMIMADSNGEIDAGKLLQSVRKGGKGMVINLGMLNYGKRYLVEQAHLPILVQQLAALPDDGGEISVECVSLDEDGKAVTKKLMCRMAE
ncbi:MAG: hypothetical protein PHI23_02195 [Candidatus Peribacteraceae bacterium]|nr:hypothetical protein [Candidatus Peribacteraceae bacterium]